MKLYFWDWHSSLKIQRVEMEMPWANNTEAGMHDCYTSLESAKWNAKIDLRNRIAELEQAMEELNRTNIENVETLEYMRGT